MLEKHARLIITTVGLISMLASVCLAKPNVAVMQVAGNGSHEAEALRAALSTAFTDSQKVQVVEHTSTELEQISAEQKISLSGMIDPETAVTVGKLLGAKYLACAQITKYSHSRKRKNDDGKSYYIDVFDVAANYKVMVAETGAVVAQKTVSRSIDASDSSSGLDFLDSLLGHSSDTGDKDPQTVLIDLLCSTAPEFVKYFQLENKGKVIEALEDGVLIVNLGSEHGIGFDTQFKIGSLGEPVCDDEGNIIGYKDGGDPVYAFPIRDKIQPRMCYLATGYWKNVRKGIGTRIEWRTLQGDKSIIRDKALIAKLSSVKKGDEVTAGVSDH